MSRSAKIPENRQVDLEVHNTACPRNCYSTCSFRVWTDGGKVVNIAPQPLNRATPEGVCLKGLSYLERQNSPDRILYPLKKAGRTFERITWAEALDTITRKLTHFKEAYGPNSILFYAASGTSGLLGSVSLKFWKLFGGATTVYGNLCWPAGLEATRLTLGDIKHNAPWDIENARLIILWGKNPAETNVQQMIPIEKAQAGGARLIVIDPRRTPSAERADLLIQPIPGTDGLLALAAAKLLMENEAVDREFIDRYVLGFPEYARSLKRIDPAEAGRTCGVPVRFIAKLAAEIAAVKSMTIVPGYGLQRYTNGGQTVRCLLALQIISGNIGKPGACWHYADLQGDIFSTVKEPRSYYPEVEPDPVFRREIATARLGEDMMRLKNPKLKMAWLERGNPVTQNPDSGRVREALRGLEFRVVVEQFLTDTALEADIILPAKTMFEQTDIISSYWHPYLQLKPKVVEPPGEVKPETEIYYLLAARLGFSPDVVDTQFPGQGSCDLEEWLAKRLDPFPELTLERLRNGPVLAPGLEEIAFSDHTFATPSGKIELYSEAAAEKWGVSPLPTFEPPVEGQRGTHRPFSFQLLSPNTKNRIHSQFGNLKAIKSLEPEPRAVINLGDAVGKGIRDDDLIRVYNDRGELQIKARIDASLRPGCIVIVNGYWHQEGACPNSLSAGRETDMGHGAAFHDNLVDYEKWPPS